MERKKAHNVSTGLKGHGGAFCYSWESFKTVNNAAEKYSNIKKKKKPSAGHFQKALHPCYKVSQISIHSNVTSIECLQLENAVWVQAPNVGMMPN